LRTGGSRWQDDDKRREKQDTRFYMIHYPSRSRLDERRNDKLSVSGNGENSSKSSLPYQEFTWADF